MRVEPQEGSQEEICRINFLSKTYNLVLPKGDYISNHILNTGRPYESDLLSFLLKLLKREQTIIDVGANIGNHAICLAVLAKVRVHAFEPNTKAIGFLRHNVRLNELEQFVQIYEVAVGNNNSFCDIIQGIEGNLGSARVQMNANGSIPIVKLDEILVNTPIHLIKIDVEGSERDVLLGAKNILETYHPIVVLEAHDLHKRARIDEILMPLSYLRVPVVYAYTPTYVYTTSPYVVLRAMLSIRFIKQKLIKLLRMIKLV